MGQNEIWVRILGFEEFYEISSLGRIKALGRWSKARGNGKYWIEEHILNPKPDKIGYKRVLLYGESIQITRRESIHRLVAQSFIPNPENKPQVNHKNGIKTDNRVQNLEWCTSKENLAHAYATGLNVRLKGEKLKWAKLTPADVKKIRKLYKSGKYLQREIGEMFGVTREAIGRIILGRNWKHI